LAALAAAGALVAYLAWLAYAGQGGYADGPVPAFPYQLLCLLVAALAAAAALWPGRRRLRVTALVAALCLIGVVVVLYFALDSLMPLEFAGLSLLVALPLGCAMALVWRGETVAGRRQAPGSAVALVAAGGLCALAGGALSGGLSPASVLAGVGALCAAGLVRSRPMLGAAGSLLCLLPLAVAAYAQSGQLSSSPAEVVLAFVPAACC
jgi:hypothetical protein